MQRTNKRNDTLVLKPSLVKSRIRFWIIKRQAGAARLGSLHPTISNAQAEKKQQAGKKHHSVLAHTPSQPTCGM